MTKTRKRRTSASKKSKIKNIKRPKKVKGDAKVDKDYSALFKNSKAGNDVEANLRFRILKKKAQSELESEVKSSSDSDDLLASSKRTTSMKSSDPSDLQRVTSPEKNGSYRRPSLPTSNHYPSSDGDDEQSEKGSSGSMGSNRSHLSSKLQLSEDQADPEETAAYDDIERQLMEDQEKEIEYLNGVDEPINKADLPVLVKDENQNGPYMNEPMKLRISRLKRTKIWIRSHTIAEEPVVDDEVDQAIRASKEAEAKASITEDDVGVAIFDPPTQVDTELREKTLDMENKLKNAILGRLKQKI